MYFRVNIGSRSRCIHCTQTGKKNQASGFDTVACNVAVFPNTAVGVENEKCELSGVGGLMSGWSWVGVSVAFSHRALVFSLFCLQWQFNLYTIPNSTHQVTIGIFSFAIVRLHSKL